MRSEPVTIWIDRRIVMRASAIEGIGNFAVEPIEAGATLVSVRGGMIGTTQDWGSGGLGLAGEMYNQEQLAPELFRVTPKSQDYYFNHSCTPNVRGDAYARSEITVRDIAAWEELTIDYLYGRDPTTWPEAPCRCGSPVCRNPPTRDPAPP